MKKRIFLATIAMMLTTALFAGCTPTVPPAAEPVVSSEPTNAPTEEVVSDETTQEETAAPTDETDPNQVKELGTPFTKDDAYVADFRIGDAKDDVLSIAGEPEKSYDVTMEATGEVRNINDYSFGSLVFIDDKLVVIQILDETYEGPRGIKVGMQLNDVAELFASSVELDNEHVTVYYRANEGDDYNLTVPPSAVLYKGEMQTLTFSDFAKDSVADEYTVEELAKDGNYVFFEQYDLLCEFDSQGMMQSFAVRIGTPSE